ncbi:MAG: thioredoxin domain-containing protein [Bryobacteraceae bacterium]|nr:thioredoxin domain-containing protein [Bryobacteraceae bacterium]
MKAISNILLGAALTTCLAPLTLAENPPRPHQGDAVAVVDGVPLTRSNFEKAKSNKLFQARTTWFEAERKAVDEYVDEYLLDRQAKREKLTVQELLDRHVRSQLPKEPTDEALRVYYEGVDTPETFEAARGKILEYLTQRRFLKAKAAYVQSLRASAKVALQIPAPRAPISMTGVPVLGRPDARVILLEFADYECSYCQAIHPQVKKLRTEFGDALAVAFKDMPLPMHANAQKASEAAHCAADQGKFWQYHDLLFESRRFDLDGLKEHARSLKLELDVFNRCLDSGAKAAAVAAHLAEAQSLGVPGTPAFFINGRFVPSATYESLHQIIAAELTGSASAASGGSKE